MVSPCGNYIISYNGELYNYYEVRKDLQQKGVTFQTSGDTEVILKAYIFWGEECLNKFNGMFAFCIYCNHHINPHVFLARDGSGEKPLYYSLDEKELIFSSELKSFAAHKSTIDFEALNYYLFAGHTPKELSIIKDVKKLSAGNFIVLNLKTGEFKNTEWWTLPDYDPINGLVNFDETILAVDELLRNSVELRLRADVPVGVLLSGGLDSSLIASYAARYSSKKIQTYSLKINDHSLDESKHARMIANYFDTDHTELEVGEFGLNGFDNFLDYIDDPLADSSIIASYMLSTRISSEIKVALGGDGGDELFGGYGIYQDILSSLQFLKYTPKTLVDLVSKIVERFPVGFSGRNKVLSLRKGCLSQIALSTPFFDDYSRKKLFQNKVYNGFINKINTPENCRVSELAENMIFEDGMLRFHFKNQLQNKFLTKIDRSSMANGLELRSPFLDKKLIDYMFSQVSFNCKVSKNKTRILQKEIGKLRLPKNFQYERKQGFSIPIGDWFRAKNVNFKDVILDNCSDLFDESFITELINNHAKGYENGERLFSLWTLSHAKNNLGLKF